MYRVGKRVVIIRLSIYLVYVRRLTASCVLEKGGGMVEGMEKGEGIVYIMSRGNVHIPSERMLSSELGIIGHLNARPSDGSKHGTS